MDNHRFRRSLGLFLVAISAIFSYNLYIAILATETDLYTLLLTGIITWSSLCLPELATGIWLIVREAEVHESDTRMGAAEPIDVTNPPELELEATTVCPNCNRKLDTDDIVCPYCENVIVSNLI
ncbi:MAG: zinc ribbon domain-containing protein [Candidatus Thorarchaeota archaeon]|nr:zinc ribbon domain-containing protein [Candidatus Thorarchaeota archaeon]